MNEQETKRDSYGWVSRARTRPARNYNNTALDISELKKYRYDVTETKHISDDRARPKEYNIPHIVPPFI